MEKDIIEPIPKTMVKFLGCTGKMVKPSLSSVKKIVQKIHKGKLITIEQIRDKLAKDFNVQTACPASTTKTLVLLSNESKPVCYWRVIKKNGELIARYPKGIEGHASLLKKEGFAIDFNKSKPVVIGYETKLHEFA